MYLNWYRLIFFIKNRILFIGSKCVKKSIKRSGMSIRETLYESIDLAVINGSDKVLWFRSQQCLGTLTMLLVKRFSQTGLFRHLSDYVFGVRNFRIAKSMRVILFFSRDLEFIVDFKNSAKNSEKELRFWDNCIWIGTVKLSLLRREYFSLPANVLRNSQKMACQ